ncbi:beta-defensin 128 [Cricetulus griseus]|uniref:Beta-defensin n=1 Tax=Cricetulus griseus TaxID=10029 RepID=A0A8C2NA64_CRIGR|nr:beta-defensin 128 [Cricetulus griseus]XP_027276759.1 beta-defensin 128 [Cricetulus griseus]ERE71437.1 beta-defensin 20-like protein [Cricetulus griseus]
MKLLKVFIILLFVVLAGGAQPKRCFHNLSGYCRKKCKLGEIAEVGCLHGKYCCINELQNKKHKIIQKPVQSNEKPKGIRDYITLPTVTYFTITI